MTTRSSEKLPDGTQTVRTLGATLAGRSKQSPHNVALRFDDEVFTYADLLKQARGMLGAYQRAGINRGDRLLILLSPSPLYVFAWTGAALGGIVEVPVNDEFKGTMLEYILMDAAAEFILTESKYVDQIAAAIGDATALKTAIVTDTPPTDLPDPPFSVVRLEDVLHGPDPDIPDVQEHEPIAVMYTSGTTGPSKGALIAHRQAWEYAQTASILELTETDVYYAPLPLFHTAAQWACGYASFQVGATCVVKSRFSTSEFWSDVRQFDVTATFLLGAMVPFLQRQDPREDDADNPLERIMMVPMVDDLAAFKERFGVEVCTCYGSSDGNCPIWAPLGVTDPGVAGRVRPGFEVRLVDEHDIEVPVGSVGECVWRADEPWMTAIEYVGKPEATSAALRNMWFHSGDGLKQDAAGNYYFIDRIKDAIRRRGENISSFEVERDVYTHPEVLECAAIGVPSEYSEDDLVVVASPKPDSMLTADALHDYLRARMPRHMIPDRVEVIPAMPKTPTDKIKKAELRAMFGAS